MNENPNEFAGFGENTEEITEQEAMNFLIDQIILHEWDMYQALNVEGGRDPSQDDFDTFKLMRSSQFEVWTPDCILHYLQDVSAAIDAGRNLMTEKYAYMMEYTAPEYYNKHLREHLNPNTMEGEQIINRCVELLHRWNVEMDEMYPNLAKRGRPATEVGEDGMVSREIYARGEMRTYSVPLLILYGKMLRAADAAGRNLAIEERDAMVRKYGFKSIEDAEAYYAEHP